MVIEDGGNFFAQRVIVAGPEGKPPLVDTYKFVKLSGGETPEAVAAGLLTHIIADARVVGRSSPALKAVSAEDKEWLDTVDRYLEYKDRKEAAPAVARAGNVASAKVSDLDLFHRAIRTERTGAETVTVASGFRASPNGCPWTELEPDSVRFRTAETYRTGGEITLQLTLAKDGQPADPAAALRGMKWSILGVVAATAEPMEPRYEALPDGSELWWGLTGHGDLRMLKGYVKRNGAVFGACGMSGTPKPAPSSTA